MDAARSGHREVGARNGADMTKEAALKALDDAFGERLIVEFDNLANGFMGSANDKAKAKERFENGVNLHIEALAFAVATVNEKFGGGS